MEISVKKGILILALTAADPERNSLVLGRIQTRGRHWDGCLRLEAKNETFVLTWQV